MNVRQMVDFHRAQDALATIACIPVPVADAGGFGIVETDATGRVTGFQEKPQSNVTTIPGDPTRALASMGNYIFAPLALHEALEADTHLDTHHDFRLRHPAFTGPDRPRVLLRLFNNVIPGVTAEGEQGYWRDVGKLSRTTRPTWT